MGTSAEAFGPPSLLGVHKQSLSLRMLGFQVAKKYKTIGLHSVEDGTVSAPFAIADVAGVTERSSGLNELVGDFRNAGLREHLVLLWSHADSRGKSWADVMSKTVKAERTLKARFLPHEEIPVPLPILSESLSLVELVALRLSPVYYGSGVPAGDGTAVVIVPGFLGIDLVLFELHAWLARIGYRPYFSGMGLAAECPDMLAQNLLSTIERAHLETGRKVHLIGHSLGGIFARSAAVRMPNRINSVTTLGSPFRGLVVHAFVLMLANLVRRRIRTRYPKLQGCATSRCSCDFARSLRHNWPRSVAQTAIYTRDDGIVDWRYCVTGDPRVDIEVGGTHIGLIVNSTTYFRIAERLAEPRVRGRRRCTAKQRPWSARKI